MRTSQPSQSSLLYSLPALADRSGDTLITTERSPRYLYVRHRTVGYAVQPGIHDSVVLTELGIRLFHKEVQT
jgi:hypothetical protein